jgi:hypothetical protein
MEEKMNIKIDLKTLEHVLAALKKGEAPQVCTCEMRSLASGIMALTATKDVPMEGEIRDMRGRGLFIEADALSEIKPGDCHGVDAINMSLGAAGFDAGYANIVSLNGVTVSLFYLDGEDLGIVVRLMESMVVSWDGNMIRKANNES